MVLNLITFIVKALSGVNIKFMENNVAPVCRYTFFIVLYPMGVAGELLTIYAALPYVQKTGLYSVALPNKYNFSFDYYTFLILTMVSYIPCKCVFMYSIIFSLRFLA